MKGGAVGDGLPVIDLVERERAPLAGFQGLRQHLVAVDEEAQLISCIAFIFLDRERNIFITCKERSNTLLDVRCS